MSASNFGSCVVPIMQSRRTRNGGLISQVAVLPRVQIEHEIDQRALQFCALRR